MPIKAVCQCGASFAAKDELAGKRVRCPKCKQPMTIPGGPAGGGQQAPAARQAQQRPAQQRPAQPRPAAPAPASAMDNLFDEAGLEAARGPRCPQCNTPLKPNAVLCVSCGFNLQSGTKLEGAKAAGPGGHEGTADAILDFAAKEIEQDKVELAKETGGGAPFFVYLFMIIVILAFGVMMLTMPRDEAFEITGGCIIGFAFLMIEYYNIRFVISAFYEEVKQGLLVMFVPCYAFYYMATRWDTVGIWVIKSVMMLGLAGVGFVFIWMAPLFEERGDGSVPQFEPTRAVVRAEQSELRWADTYEPTWHRAVL